MFTRCITAIVLLAGLSILGIGAGSAQGQDTFTLSVGAYNCDADPQQNPNVTCVPNGGTVVIVTLESGEFVGSCILEVFDTPNGVGSGCGIEGVPFNSTLVIYEDESTLPADYVSTNSPQIFETTDLIPGGGDGPVISFINVQVDPGSADTPAEEPMIPEVTDGDAPAAEEPADNEPASERDEEATVSEREADAPESEGRAAAVYTGSCDRLDDVAAELPNIVDPQGRLVGQSSAIEAATASTTVDIPLDVLLDKEHAIVVLESNAPDSAAIACGDIGGVDNDDGELVVGLSEVDDSGFIGMVYLAYNAADGSQTNVSLFLAEGLASNP